MFSFKYFAPRYFARRYFPGGSDTVVASVHGCVHIRDEVVTEIEATDQVVTEIEVFEEVC